LAPFAPAGPAGPWGPGIACGSVAPSDVMVMSRVAAWPVSSFSLLSRRRLAESEVSAKPNAKPKLLAGVVTLFCTSAVTSSVTYCLGAEAMKMPEVAPRVGAEEAVTEDSLQAEVAGERVTEPAVLTRLTKTVRVAHAISAEVVPAGSVLRSNCRNAELPFPT